MSLLEALAWLPFALPGALLVVSAAVAALSDLRRWWRGLPLASPGAVTPIPTETPALPLAGSPGLASTSRSVLRA